MKKTNIKYIFIILISIITIITCFYNIDTSKISNAYENNSAEIVMETNTNRVLYANNAYEKKFMASTTKILTAITIIENCNLNSIITISKDTIGVEGSSIYLEEGEKLSVKHLLYGLMLRSGNDCAKTLAVYCSKTEKEFANLMNETSKKIGAKNSNFVNAHGLHDENHYTTAYDLALISSYAMKNKDFREIVSTKRIVIPQTTREYNRVLINKNKMLTEFNGSTGIKTGYTKKAGRCLVSSCLRNGMELICVVLNCPPMWEVSKNLLSTCFNNYQLYNLVESDNIIDFITLKNGKKYGVYIKKDISIPLTKEEYNKISIEYALQKNIDENINKDICVGYVKIYCKNNLLFSEKIYTII